MMLYGRLVATTKPNAINFWLVFFLFFLMVFGCLFIKIESEKEKDKCCFTIKKAKRPCDVSIYVHYVYTIKDKRKIGAIMRKKM